MKWALSFGCHALSPLFIHCLSPIGTVGSDKFV
jgi:hypothetical protein